MEQGKKRRHTPKSTERMCVGEKRKEGEGDKRAEINKSVEHRILGWGIGLTAIRHDLDQIQTASRAWRGPPKQGQECYTPQLPRPRDLPTTRLGLRSAVGCCGTAVRGGRPVRILAIPAPIGETGIPKVVYRTVAGETGPCW